ncbi:hypothetical protein BTZ20_1781 [Rhodococcus sp. MTM3W5.2]|nr:hypothetical protein BTZ20_1781 [Rhodococcus sp. MTM3W5.2]
MTGLDARDVLEAGGRVIGTGRVEGVIATNAESWFPSASGSTFAA